MKDHELKVKHVDNGKEFLISKTLYQEDPKQWEVLEGEVPESGEPKAFQPPKAPGKPKLTDNPKVKGDGKKQGEGAEANKMGEGAEANKAATPPPK